MIKENIMKYYDENKNEITKAEYQTLVFEKAFTADFIDKSIIWYDHNLNLVAMKKPVLKAKDI